MAGLLAVADFSGAIAGTAASAKGGATGAAAKVEDASATGLLGGRDAGGTIGGFAKVVPALTVPAGLLL